MRSFFRSEYAALFTGPPYAFRTHDDDKGNTLVRRIPKVQSVSYGFDINREEIKQIGHDDLLTRRINVTQSDPPIGSNIDINIEPVPVNLSFEYLPTCGLTEYLLNFNVREADADNTSSFIARNIWDQNFFLVLRDDIGQEARFLQKNSDFNGHHVIGIGNAFAVRYYTDISIGSPMKSRVDFQASNIKIDRYSNENFIPAIDLAAGRYSNTHKYFFGPDDMGEEYNAPAILPNYVNITIQELNIGGPVLSKQNANAAGFSIELDLNRRNLYGFGSMYPYNRKLNLPARGNLNLSITKKDLLEGNLNEILRKDKSYDITIECGYEECDSKEEKCDANNIKKLKYAIDNAVLKSESSDLRLKDYATIDLNFDFTVTRENGLALHSYCLDKDLMPGHNDSNDQTLDKLYYPINEIRPSPTVTPTITRTPAPTPSITPSMTKTPVVPSVTPTPSITRTPAATPAVTPSITPTASPIPAGFNVRFQSQSTYVVEGQSADVTLFRDIDGFDNPYMGPFDVGYAIESQPESAQSGIDFVGKVGVVSFGEGETEKTITVETIEDVIDEDTEYFKITIDQPTNVPASVNFDIIEMNPYHVLLLDDDQLRVTNSRKQYVRFQYQSTYVVEGNKAKVRIIRDEQISDPCNAPFQVSYITESAGSAQPGQDYEHQSSFLLFAEDEMEREIEIQTLPVLANTQQQEMAEFFNIKLYDPISVEAEVEIVGPNPYSVFIVEPS